MKKAKDVLEDNKTNSDVIDRIIEDYKGSPEEIMGMLQDIQVYFNYLPREALKFVAGRIKMPLSRIYHIATFYSTFSLTPRGKYTIYICTGTACHVRGAPLLLKTIQRELDINIGETTKDSLFTLEAVRCIGACSIAPAIRINHETFGPLTSAGLSKLLKGYKKK